jgi:hypothetical protein
MPKKTRKMVRVLAGDLEERYRPEETFGASIADNLS